MHAGWHTGVRGDMSAADTFDDAHRAGLVLRVYGENIRVYGDLGGELRGRLAEYKAEIVEMLRMRDRMMVLAGEVGVERAVERLSGAELQAWVAGSPTYRDDEVRCQALMLYLHDLVNIEWDPAPDRKVDSRQPGEFGDWRDGFTSLELSRIRNAGRPQPMAPIDPVSRPRRRNGGVGKKAATAGRRHGE